MQTTFQENAFSGHVFVFRRRRAEAPQKEEASRKASEASALTSPLSCSLRRYFFSCFALTAPCHTSQGQQPHAEQRQRCRLWDARRSFSRNDPELLHAIRIVAPRSVECVV